MAVFTMRYAIEKGGEVVAAFDINPEKVGKDIGEIMGTGETGVIVASAEQLGRVLAETKPDVCIITTRGRMAEMEEVFTICAQNGVNAITPGEEALYPWNSAPAITGKLDQLAKAHGVTFCGSGYSDTYWGVLVAAVAGTMHRIDRIEGISSYNLEEYGIATAEADGAGLTAAEFDAEFGSENSLSAAEQTALIGSGESAPSIMWNQNGWLASRLGLTVVSQRQEYVPIFSDDDVPSATLGRVIPAGDVLGLAARVTTETAEGITLVTQAIGKVYEPGDFDRNDWTFHGEPTTAFSVDRPATVELTCAAIVNRIPAVLNAAPGFITTDQLPDPEYLVRPINEYVHQPSPEVTVSPVAEADLPDVLALWNNGEVMKFVGFPDGVGATMDGIERWYANVVKGRPRSDTFAIHLAGIGYVGEAHYSIDDDDDGGDAREALEPGGHAVGPERSASQKASRRLGDNGLSDSLIAALDIKLIPEARGRGVAYRALSHAISEAFANGARKVWVDPHPDNQKALALYRKLGFEPAVMPEKIREQELNGTDFMPVYLELARSDWDDRDRT
ncbi:MAG: GNAT family N-acetyltransferase [Promicromonosporaceae bacterium]|nr:GNAT family N-acetyltransferase [Promicromonosporaceae bacterium]